MSQSQMVRWFWRIADWFEQDQDCTEALQELCILGRGLCASNVMVYSSCDHLSRALERRIGCPSLGITETLIWVTKCSPTWLTQIESLCLNCCSDGTTRLLMTEIPFFKQVVIMSFECPHCHYTNNEVQPAQQIAERAVRYTVTCDSAQVWPTDHSYLWWPYLTTGSDEKSCQDWVGGDSDTRSRVWGQETERTHHYHRGHTHQGCRGSSD